MATDGLSLVGFMDEQAGIAHLRRDCIPPDPTDTALKAAWQQAQGQRGPVNTKAGNPDIEPIPPANASYILQLTQLPWVAAPLRGISSR